MYYVYTGNRFNQILIFDTFEDAFEWCRSATRWTDEEIKKAIKEPKKQEQGNYSYIMQ